MTIRDQSPKLTRYQLHTYIYHVGRIVGKVYMQDMQMQLNTGPACLLELLTN